MKKLISSLFQQKLLRYFASISLFFMSQAIFAQAGFGIRGGVNFSKVYTHSGSIGKSISDSYDTKTGWAYGVYGRIGKTVYFQPELLVSTQKGSINITPLNTSTPAEVDISQTSLELPLLIGFQPIKFLRVMAGPSIALKINNDQKVIDALKTYYSDFNYSSKNAVWGYQAGVGVHLLGLDIDLRRMGGLSDVSFLNIKDSESTQKIAGWQLSVGFKIL